MQLSPNFRALVSNNQDSRLVAITGATGNGIAVIDLNAVPEPAPLPYFTSETAPHGVISQIRQARSVSVDVHRSRNSPFAIHRIHRRPSPLVAGLTHRRMPVPAANLHRPLAEPSVQHGTSGFEH
jgi:hypothetical protein